MRHSLTSKFPMNSTQSRGCSISENKNSCSMCRGQAAVTRQLDRQLNWQLGYPYTLSAYPTVPAPSLMIPLPANSHPRQAADDGSSTWVPVIHMGDLAWVLGSRLQPGPVLDVASIWGTKHHIKEFCLPLFFSAFPIKKIKFGLLKQW